MGNKCDMEEERVVPTEKGRLLAEQLGMYMTHVCACVCAPRSEANGEGKCMFVFVMLWELSCGAAVSGSSIITAAA